MTTTTRTKTRAPQSRPLLACVLTLGLLGSITAAAAPSAVAEPVPPPGPRSATTAPERLTQEPSYYPRAIALEHQARAGDNGTIIANVATDTAAGAEGIIYESTDEGRSFTEVGRVQDPWGATGRFGCCESLFELPQQVGDMPEGTLIWAGSLGQAVGQAQLRLWRSDDLGRSWSYLSTCHGARNALGLWEPELSVDARGRLVCHFADETEQPQHSQQLARTVSEDGLTWSAKQPTVVAQDPGARPGMPVVRRLEDGTYRMVYEICGQPDQYDCEVRIRSSADGWDWGTSSDLGTRPQTADGRYFAHTPTITTTRTDNGATRLLLVGQILENADGSVAEGNGRTLLTNEDGGRGPWGTAPAPVRVPGARNDVCPNYSSTLLPVSDGRRLLEIATDYPQGQSVCAAWFATGPLPAAGPHDTRPTVIIDGVDTGVANTALEGGDTVADRVDADGVWAEHAVFLRHVTAVLRDLRADGVLGARQVSAIMRAAATSDIGRGSSVGS